MSFSIPTENKPSKPVKYEFVETQGGVWRKYRHKNGHEFKEYRSHAELFGLPLVNIVSGVDPEHERMATAHGIVAIGQRARGGLAIGQFCSGYVSIGQFCTARIAGIGQFVAAPIGVGQFSIALLAVGQVGVAGWAIFQQGAVAFGGLGQQIFNLLDWLPPILT